MKWLIPIAGLVLAACNPNIEQVSRSDESGVAQQRTDARHDAVHTKYVVSNAHYRVTQPRNAGEQAFKEACEKIRCLEAAP